MCRHIRKHIHFLLLFLFSTIDVFAQVLPDSITKRIDDLFTRWNNTYSPGCVIGVVRNDSLIYAKGYGSANLEYGIPNTPETIYHMASVSKQFTGYAIVLLAAKGRLGLDDDVRKHLSWFPDLKEKITIRHLLNHTSGIRDQWQLLAISGTRIDDVITQDHIIKLLSQQQALNFKPGTQYSYSNSGFTMLAEIVKSVTGQTLRKFADSAIFKPLGMNNTHFHDDYTEVVKNRSYSYGRRGAIQYANSILSYSNAGATSLFTNVNDMARWIVNFYHPKVGSQEQLKELTTKGKLNNGRELPYALGIVSDNYKGWRQYSHGGGDAGYRTYVTVFPDLKMGFVILSNVSDFNPFAKLYEVVDVFIKDTSLKGHTPAAAAVDDSRAILQDSITARRLAGHYIAEDGVQFDFAFRDRKLFWERNGRSDVLLKGQQDSFFVASAPEVKFIFNTKRKPDTTVNQFWPEGERLLEKYDGDIKQTDEQLQQYTGTYHSPELDCRYGIVLKNHELVLTSQKYPDVPIKLVGKNDLMTGHWWMTHLRLIRSKTNRISGFEVNAGRIMHLRFNKTD